MKITRKEHDKYILFLEGVVLYIGYFVKIVLLDGWD